MLKHVNGKVGDWIKKKRAGDRGGREGVPSRSSSCSRCPRRGGSSPPALASVRCGVSSSPSSAPRPIPKEWKGNGIVPGTADLSYAELRGEYYATLDEASEPQKQRAKVAFKTCLDYSVKYQYFDEYSRTCEVWLPQELRRRVPPHRRVPWLSVARQLRPERAACAAEPRRDRRSEAELPAADKPAREAGSAHAEASRAKADDKKGRCPRRSSALDRARQPGSEGAKR